MAFINFVKSVDCEIYEKCKQVLLDNYREYLTTGDMLWFSNYYDLIKSHKKVNKPTEEALILAYYRFFDDMLRITQNEEIIERLQKKDHILKLQTKYNSVTVILYCIEQYDMALGKELLEQHITNLESWNYRLDRNKTLFPQIDRIKNRVQGILTEIDLLEKEISKKDKIEAQTIDEDIITVAEFLDMRYPIDPKTTYTDAWFLLQKRANDKALKIKSKDLPK